MPLLSSLQAVSWEKTNPSFYKPLIGFAIEYVPFNKHALCFIKQMLKFIVFATFFVCLSASCMPLAGPADILINQPHFICMTINGNERTVFYPKVDQYGRYVYKGCTCCFT